MDIGTNIKKVRELKDITADQMALELGISLSGYHKIERNETDISLKRLAEIAKVLKVDLGKILNFDVTHVFNITTHDSSTGNGIVETQEITGNDEVWKELVHQLRSEIEYLRTEIKNIK